MLKIDLYRYISKLCAKYHVCELQMLCTLRHAAVSVLLVDVTSSYTDGSNCLGVCRPIHNMEEKKAKVALICYRIQHSRLYCRSMLCCTISCLVCSVLVTGKDI